MSISTPTHIVPTSPRTQRQPTLQMVLGIAPQLQT